MLFNSLTFLVFFFLVFSCHQLVHGSAARNRLLLVASYIFYAAWYPPYLAILVFSTTLDWWLARRIDRAANQKSRKALLIVSLVCNFALLGFFKYGGFLLENFSALLTLCGISTHVPAWNIVLPIGISFYTFASLSYTIDVYRREIHADSSWINYALFVSFFPHLIAGPIVRAKLLLPQIAERRRASAEQIRWGLTLTIFGLFAKTVVADSIFAPVVEQVYANPSNFSALDTWAAVLGFSGQIYFDFSGYSLCAIGLALCFGFEFPDNFKYPYAAASFVDFWRRWHITLSTWLRDYLYIPLGGSRNGSMQTYRNLMLTMLLGGIWHGASWMFVLWGGLHGTYLAAERWHRDRSVTEHARIPSFFRSTAIFFVVTLTWIPFRSPDVESAIGIATNLFPHPASRHLGVTSIAWVFAMIAITLVWHRLQRETSLGARFSKASPLLMIVSIAVCLFAIFLCSGGDERAFIYFQF